MDQVVSEVAAAYDHPAADGSVKFRKKDGFVAAPAVEGVTVDAAALGQALNAALADPRGDVALDVPVSHQEPAVSTRDALAAAISANWMSSQQLKLTGGGHPLKISAPKLAALLTFGALAGWWLGRIGEREGAGQAAAARSRSGWPWRRAMPPSPGVAAAPSASSPARPVAG